MRNFLQAFLTFIVFACIAQFVHQEKKSSLKLNSPQTKVEVKTDSKTQNKKIKKDKDSLVIKPKNSTKKIRNEFNKELQQLVFNHKFVTSANNTRVIFPRAFYYFKDSVFNFLNNNQEKELIITADYTEKESDSFGLARANYLKNKLVNYGVNTKRILTKSKLSNYQYDRDGYYADGIYIEHQNMNPEKSTLLVKEITNKTLHAYFGDNTFKADRTLFAYTLAVKKYLTDHPDKKILITGHTDNVGEEETNKWIALQRAKNVANYFISQGIDASKIITDSKGETQPIDNNNTQAGRANNRRIEITIN